MKKVSAFILAALLFVPAVFGQSADKMTDVLKSGEVTNYCRCEECDYCRDTYKCKVLSAEEFETSVS